MIPTDLWQTPGEHPFTFEGEAGALEGIIMIPPDADCRAIALLGHPHSLQGGQMNNKVVTTMARAFRACGIPSLRFNFRGVNQSVGQYDAGIGESDDMHHLQTLCQKTHPDAQYFFAGFSFGSFVAYRAASLGPHVALITVAPPVHHYDYVSAAIAPKPWFIIQGTDDDVVPLDLVETFAHEHHLPLEIFPETGHFFHGKLLLLQASVEKIIRGVACA